jgi:hypothetical protein
MSGLSESEREARLHSDEFRGRFKKHEQKLIEELHNVVPQ